LEETAAVEWFNTSYTVVTGRGFQVTVF